MERTFRDPQGTHHYRYHSADSTTFAYKAGEHGFNAYRTKKLSGRANIYISDEAKNDRTNVMVNVKYVVDIDLQIQRLYPQASFNHKASHDFSSKSPYTEQMNEGGMAINYVCRSNGALENMILDAASGLSS